MIRVRTVFIVRWRNGMLLNLLRTESIDYRRNHEVAYLGFWKVIATALIKRLFVNLLFLWQVLMRDLHIEHGWDRMIGLWIRILSTHIHGARHPVLIYILLDFQFLLIMWWQILRKNNTLRSLTDLVIWIVTPLRIWIGIDDTRPRQFKHHLLIILRLLSVIQIPLRVF